MGSRVAFTESNHSYWWINDSGKKERIPSITGLVRQEAKDNLIDWAAREAANCMTDNWDALQGMPPSERFAYVSQAHKRKKGTAAAKGTQIHAWADALLKGEPVDIPDDYARQVQIFANWWMVSGFVAERTENIVWSDEDEWGDTRYAGRYDCLAIHPKHGWTLLDFKTGSGVWPEAGIQLAGYADAEFEVIDGQDRRMQHLDTLAAVHVRPDGTTLFVLSDQERRVAQQRWRILRSLKTVGKPEFMEVVA